MKESFWRRLQSLCWYALGSMSGFRNCGNKDTAKTMVVSFLWWQDVACLAGTLHARCADPFRVSLTTAAFTAPVELPEDTSLGSAAPVHTQPVSLMHCSHKSFYWLSFFFIFWLPLSLFKPSNPFILETKTFFLSESTVPLPSTAHDNNYKNK